MISSTQNARSTLTTVARVGAAGICGLLWTAFPALSEEAVALDIRPYEAAAVCGAQPLQVEVTVVNTTPKGILAVELYEEDPPEFLKDGARLHRIRVPAEAEQQTVCFDVPMPGLYAVVTYHDVDANRKFDKKWTRLPAEPWGLSNNPGLKLRAPRFEDAAFMVGALGEMITISLQNTD